MNSTTYTVLVTNEGSEKQITEWYRGGIRHRLDGPAIEFADGGKHWFVDGKRHRRDGPAVEGPYDLKEWWVNGKRHRIDGPAVEFAGYKKRWFVYGIEYFTEAEWQKVVNKLNKPEPETIVIDGKRYRLTPEQENS